MANLYSDVIEVSITAATWQPVTLPSTASARAFMAKCRNNSQFKVSPYANGSKYITIPLSFEDEIDEAGVSSTLFYVQGTTTTTLEVLLRDR